METMTHTENTSSLRVTVDDGVACVEFDLLGSKVNKLTTPLMNELEALFDGFALDDAVRAVVLASGKPDTFIAGADIDEIESLTSMDEAREKSRFGQRVFAKIEGLGKPVVAAIHGACLGGGCELILACHYRIATDEPATRLGLPEVKLGIVPGFGGTQRLPRVVGLQAALDLILSGRMLDAKRAMRMRLVDGIAYRGLLVEEATAAARRLADSGRFKAARPSRYSLVSMPGFLDRTALGQSVVLRAATKRVRAQTQGHYPAPLAALQAVRSGLRRRAGAYEREAELLAQMALTPESGSLMHLFRLTEANKRVGADLPEPTKVQQVGVVGAGVMGGGIAQLAASKDIRVRLKDIQPDALLLALRTARDIMHKAKKRRRINSNQYENKMALISTTLAYEGFSLADLVIEAVVENMGVKCQVLRELETQVRSGCVIATNTSALSVTRMAETLRDPGRLIGMHFFNPVHRMPLVEVVTSSHTRPESIAAVVALARRLGKTPVVVRDAPGFLVNRILAPFMNESSLLFEEGQSVQAIDRTMRRYGMPMGPFELIDEIGTDVAEKVGHTLHEGLGAHMKPSTLAGRLVQSGRLGRKSDAGMYRYDKGKRKADPAFWESLRDDSQRSGIGEDTQRDRVFGLMLNEAARCLEEGVVASAGELDLALVFGIGFPPFRGGLLRDADARGVETWVQRLDELAGQFGERFEPCERLRRMAVSGDSFYGSASHT